MALQRRRWKRLRNLLFLFAALMGLLAVAVLGTAASIGHSVHGAVTSAQARFGGDPVEALMRVAETDSLALRERNQAIWALGQLGDARALPLLDALYTGEPCDHQHQICQHELRKARRLCSGGVNLSAPLWRHRVVAAR
jgi:hypothetical protein